MHLHAEEVGTKDNFKQYAKNAIRHDTCSTYEKFFVGSFSNRDEWRCEEFSRKQRSGGKYMKYYNHNLRISKIYQV